MPSLIARICGICPVSHLMASAKVCDENLAVSPPEVEPRHARRPRADTLEQLELVNHRLAGPPPAAVLS